MEKWQLVPLPPSQVQALVISTIGPWRLPDVQDRSQARLVMLFGVTFSLD